MRIPAGSRDTTGDRGAVDLRSASGRPLWAGLTVSAILHVAVIWFYPWLLRRIVPEPSPFAFPVSAVAAEGMDVIQLVEVRAELDEPPPPERAPERPQPVAVPVTAARVRPSGADAGPEAPVVGRTAAERLRPNLEDERLWSRVDPALTELTLEQREELAISGRIEAWRDSVATASAAAADAADWTVTDADGKKWGVSAGSLHLGGITLPLPFGFGTPMGRREEALAREWKWNEIHQAAIRGEVRDSWKERAAKMRERRDRARARADSSGTGG